MTDRTRGVLYLICAAVMWSFGGLLIKLITMHPMATAGARSAIAGLALLALTRPITARFTRLQFLGALCYAGTVILFVLATTATTAANAILLQYTAPIYVALLSFRLLGERITGLDWWAILFVLGGMVLFFLDGLEGGAFVGNVLAVASGVFFALNVVLLRKERHGSPMAIILLGNLMAAVIGLPFLAVTPPTAADLAYLLPLGLFQLALGYLLFVRGVRHVTAIEGTLIPVIEPLLNPLWVALFFGELPSRHAIIGGGIVLATVTVRGLLKAGLRSKFKVTGSR